MKYDHAGRDIKEEYPFAHSKRDLRLHQDKLKARIYTYMQQYFDEENTKFGVTRVEALRRTR